MTRMSFAVFTHGQRVGRGVGTAVGNTDVDFRDAELGAEFACRAGQSDVRSPPHLISHLDIAPLDAAGPTRSQRLQHRLFGGKTARVMLRSSLAGRAILDFMRRINARKE